MTTPKRPVRPIPKKRKPKKKHRILLTLLMICVMLGLIACVAVGGYVISLAKELPDITAEDLVNAQNSFVYDETGLEIATLHGGENRVTVDLDEMPTYLRDAVVASEDIRFYQHNGIDYRSVMRALVVDVIDTIKAGQLTFTQGASTITMQLMKNVSTGDEKTIPRKIKQALLALEFEKDYDKDEILYYYLNEIYMGANIYGMQAASEYYFNKHVSEITMSEAALLVAILRAPAYYSPYTQAERVLPVRNSVLNSMIVFDDELYGITAEAAKSDAIVVYEGGEEGAAYDYPWFVDHVVEEAIEIVAEMGMDDSYVYTGGLHIHTTLDTSVQTALETVYANEDGKTFPESKTGDIVESAMAIVEPTTGQIKGLIGGRVYETRRGFNRATDLIRSPGSTIKPLVTYGPAIELGYGAGYVIDDSPVKLGTFSPNNDDHKFKGRITLRQAVMQSRNICAVKLSAQIGTETGWAYANKMGLELPPSDAANWSLTLGGMERGVSPLKMAAAFATFANNGVYTKPYSITRITNARGEVIYSAVPELTEVFAPASAYIMTDVLMSAVSGGTGTAARISGWQTAGKTGTVGLPPEDPDYRGKSGTKDAWFCGYTTALSGAIWLGYDNKWDNSDPKNLQYLSNIYGGSYPAEIFRKVMTLALENYENKNFTRPDGVSGQTVDTKTGNAPTELTPAEFIGSDMVRSGMGMGGDGTAWKMVELCADTGLLANDFCYNRDGKPMLVLPDGKLPSEKVADYKLYAPVLTCSQHLTYQGNMASAYVCTDPRHQGVVKLANIAARGSSGGCADEYVTLRYYSYGSIPSAYCNLAEHQVSGEVASPYGDSDYEREEEGWDWSELFGKDKSTPNTPTGLSAVPTESGVYVSWSASNSDEVSYVLNRIDANGSEERFVVYGKEYLDSTVELGGSYTYQVFAYNEYTQKTSDWSSAASVSY